MVWKSFVLLYYSSKYVKQRFNLSLVTKVSRQRSQNTYLAGKKTYINFLISLQWEKIFYTDFENEQDKNVYNHPFLNTLIKYIGKSCNWKSWLFQRYDCLWKYGYWEKRPFRVGHRRSCSKNFQNIPMSTTALECKFTKIVFHHKYLSGIFWKFSD